MNSRALPVSGRNKARSAFLRLLETLWRKRSVAPEELSHVSLREHKISVDAGHRTHPGLRRPENQDAYRMSPGLRLWLVADGMGGHAHGDVASAIATDMIVREMENGETLSRAIVSAHDCVAFAASIQAARARMGTTIAALHWDVDSSVEIAWVGDSRIYVLHEGALRQVSRDHSLIQRWIDAGIVAPEDAARHTMRNVLTQALGVTDMDKLQIETRRIGISRGCRFLLCSDGLTCELSDAEITAILSRPDQSVQVCADALLEAALARGGSDNITVIVLGFN